MPSAPLMLLMFLPETSSLIFLRGTIAALFGRYLEDERKAPVDASTPLSEHGREQPAKCK
jgi:hypothetical protein